VLTAYALVANWQLAREAGLLAFGVGGLWSAAVAFGVARTTPRAPGAGAQGGRRAASPERPPRAHDRR
jgi:hypothetical protein